MGLLEAIQRSLAAAAEVLEAGPTGNLETECEVLSWPQSWGDTSCGFGGMAGQALTAAQCVVVLGPNGDAAVCHAGRLARYLKHPSPAFFEALGRRRLPGKTESWAGYDRPEEATPATTPTQEPAPEPHPFPPRGILSPSERLQREEQAVLGVLGRGPARGVWEVCDRLGCGGQGKSTRPHQRLVELALRRLKKQGLVQFSRVEGTWSLKARPEQPADPDQEPVSATMLTLLRKVGKGPNGSIPMPYRRGAASTAKALHKRGLIFYNARSRWDVTLSLAQAGREFLEKLKDVP